MKLHAKGISILNRTRTQLGQAWQAARANAAALLSRDEDARKQRELLKLLAACYGLTPFNPALRNALPALAPYRSTAPQPVPATPRKPASTTPLLLQSATLTLALTDSSVMTEKAHFTAHDADEIALLCALNPAMHKEPVKLHGDARACYLLNLAVTARGLAIENPQSFATLTDADKEILNREWESRHQPAHAQPQPEPQPQPKTPEAKPEPQPALPPSVQQALARAATPLPENIRTLLQDAGIDEPLYREARESAIARKTASLTRLRKDFALSPQQAALVLEAFTLEGITARTVHTRTERKTRTDHKVILKPEDPLPPPPAP